VKRTLRSNDGSERLRRLRTERRLSQNDLANALGVTVSAVSHWETGRKQPDAASCIALGKLAGYPDCWFWWERAGLTEDELLAAAPEVEARILDLRMAGRYPEVSIVSGPRIRGDGGSKPKSGFVMLPLLMQPAAAARPRLIEEEDVEDFFLFPRSWVLHPEMTTLIRLVGDEMAPLLGAGSLVAVDAAIHDPRKLRGDVVVVLVGDRVRVGWLGRLGENWVLTSENADYEDYRLSAEDRILGSVAFWYGRKG